MTQEELEEIERQNREGAERLHEEERLNKSRDELEGLFDSRRTFWRDGQGSNRVGDEGREKDWTPIAADRMVDSSGRKYYIAPWEHEDFYKAAKERGIAVKPMEKMVLRHKFGVAHEEYVNPFNKESVEWHRQKGYVGEAQAESQKTILEFALDPKTYTEGFSNPDTWKDLPKNIVKGTGTAAYSVGSGLAKFTVDTALDGAGAVSRLLGFGDWQAEARAAVERGFKSADDWIAENVWGAKTEQEKEAVGLGLAPGKVYGEMGLGFGIVGKLGKWAPHALFALQGFERAEEDPNLDKAGLRGDIVAVANAVAGAVAGPVITRLAGGGADKPAKAALGKTFAEAFARSIGESVHGGAVMGFMEGANQAARGAMGIEDTPVLDESGNQVYDEDGNAVMRRGTAQERVASTLSAFAHGTATIGMLKAFDLAAKGVYDSAIGGSNFRNVKRAVTYEVEMARRRYAPNLVKSAETARMFAQSGMPLPQGRGKLGELVKGVTTNGEVVFADGSVYYPPRAERVVAGESAETSRVVPGRDARIVVSDGTILDAQGNVVGIAASGQKLYNDAETVAETYARQTDPSAEAAFTTINPATGSAGPQNIMDFAPEKYRQYVEWTKGGRKGEAPELDAESFLFSRLVALAKGEEGADLANAAQLALGDVAAGRSTVRDALEGLDRAEASFNGEAGRRRATAGVEELLSSDVSSDTVQTKTARLTPVVEGEIRATSPAEDGNSLSHAAVRLVDLSTENGIVPEDVDITGIALPEGQRYQVAGEGAGKATSETPIFLWQNPESGKLEVVDGGKRLSAEVAAGAKTVKAVVLRPEDGWKTREDADAVAAVANIRSGSLDDVALVDAFARLGLNETDAAEAGLAIEARSFEAIEVASHATADVRGMVSAESLPAIAAVTRMVNAETFGAGWEAAQKNLAARAGKVPVGEIRAAAELSARLAGEIAAGRVTADEVFEAARAALAMGRELPTDVAGLRALQEAAAKDAPSKVPVEGADGKMTTLADAISEVKAKGPADEPPPPGAGSVSELAVKERGNGLKLVNVDYAEDGLPVFGCAEFPGLRIARGRPEPGTGRKVVDIYGLSVADFTDAAKSRQLARLLGEFGDSMARADVKMNFEPWTKPYVERLLDFYDSEIVTSKAYETRRNSVIKTLEKSGLASGVVVDEAAFNAALAANGKREYAVDGLTYGIADPESGRIYLNPHFFGTRVGLETPIHEFGHLGIMACRRVNRAVFDRGMALARQTDLFKELSAHPDYGRMSEAERAEEVLAQLIGKRGAARLKAETNKGVVAEIKSWIVDFWHSFAKAMGLRDITPEQAERMSIEDVVDAINAEMMSGRTFGSKPMDVVSGDARAKIARYMGYKPGKDGRDTPRAKAALREVKDAWRELDAFQKANVAAAGGADPNGGAALGTPAAKSWAKVIDSLREWDAWRKRRSRSTKEQMRRNPSAAQKQIVRAGRDFYVENHEADPHSPFAFFVTEGARMLIPGKGDYGFDWWNNMQNGLKAHERKELKRFLAGEGYGNKKGGNDTLVREWLEWRLGRMPTPDEEMNAPSFEEFMDAVMAGEADYQAWKRSGKLDTRADREAREMEEYDELQRHRERRDLDTIAAQQDADRREMERMGDFESERPSRESDYYWNNTDFSRRLRFARAMKPSALGDGKQRYYEVPFDKAVDKIVKNKKPVSDEHVFVSETPKPFADIGFAKLPVMMGQGHVISCYFGEGEGVEGKHLHKMKGNLKLLPKALEKPLMIITSESSPSDSVVAILKMKDNTGASVIVPVKMSGVGRVGKDLVDAHIALTMFGKKNAWKSLVANALEKEANGEVGVFYIDGAESKTILERLGEKAKGLGIAGLQSPGETKAHRNPENGSSGLQSPSASISQGTVHSIADEGSPVKGGIVSQTATRQFKNWFDKSQVVDENGEPLVVYRRDNEAFNVFDVNKAQQNDAGWLGKGFYFYGDRREAESATGYGKNLREFYLKAENPYYITPEEYNRLVEADDPRVSAEFTERLREEGYDSVYWNGDGRKEWMVLEPTQIKSATDNIGTFDPGNPDIRYSRSGIFTGTAADYANRSRQGGVDDGPSVKKIGTGEGSQVYGWGLYGSTVRGVAEGYARPNHLTPEGLASSTLHQYSNDRDAAIAHLQKYVDSGRLSFRALTKEEIARTKGAIEILKSHAEKSGHLYEQTFFTDRAPGDESHLLKWYDEISDANWDRVIAQAEKEGLRDKLKGAWWLHFNGDLEHFITDNGNSGDAIYERLSKLLGSPQAASEFLYRAGIDGVKYPVDSYGKTVKDGDKAGWNYAAFSDEHIRVDHKWTDGQQRYSRRLTGFDGPSGGMAPATAAGETSAGTRAANRQRTAEERDPGRALWEVPWHLNPNGPGGAPVQKPLALGMAETVRLVEALTGKSPTSFRRTKTGRNAEDAWTSKGRVGVAKDLLRVLDEGDAAKVREKMIAEGYFRAASDPTWAVTATPDELEADSSTSDGVFANRMRSIYMGRVKGVTPGGMRGATQVMANELGRIIMQMPADTGAVGRGIRTLGQGIIADFTGKGANASTFEYMMNEAADWLDYVYGSPKDAAGNRRFTAATVGAKENLRGTVGELIGWFLTSSDEMSRRAPRIYKNMLDAIEHSKRLKAAFDDIRQTALGEGAAEHAMQRVERTKTRQYEKLVEDLEREINTPIGTLGERMRDSFVYNWSNMDGPMFLHMSAAQKARLRDYKSMLKSGKLTQAEYDTLVDRDRQAIQSVKLAQLAADRGVANEIRGHFWEVNYVFQEAKAAGVDMQELDRYMINKRIIETGGRSGEGELVDPHMARRVLDEQRERLGARGVALLEETANKFRAARERNILEDERLLAAFGKETVDYWKSNVHYIRTERTLSPEELAKVEADRAKFRSQRGEGADDVIEAVMDAGRRLREGRGGQSGFATWTKALEGSFRPAKDWKVATFKNDLALMRFMERNDYVLKMREALTALGVEGVHDFAEGDRHIPDSSNERYGVIRYVEGGKRRALVVPKIIERGYAKEENSMDGWGAIGKAAHGVFIDWNFAYTLRNFTRNIHSNQANLAGMHADNVSLVGRWVLPGVSQLAEMGMTQIARHLPDYVFRNKFMRTLFGQNTNLYYSGQAQRILELYLSPKKALERRQAADEAKLKGDLAPEKILEEDLKALKFCFKGGALISRFDAVHGGGAANDFMQSHGLDRIVGDSVKRGNIVKRGGNIVKRVFSAPFRVNASINRDLELWAKITATLQQAARDPGASAQEIGMRVAEGASIPRYESRGSQAKWINYSWNMFFNTALQGTLRHMRAVRDRPGETLGKMAAQSIGPRVFWGVMIMGGGLSAIIKWIFDGDEEKARESSLGGLMDGCNKLRAAAMNNGDYLNKFYKSLPIAKWGNTTLNISSPLTDEEKLYIPLVDYATQQLLLSDTAQKLGMMPLDPVPGGADALKRTVIGTLFPDITNNRANPFLAAAYDFIGPWLLNSNPIDTYRGHEIYNRHLFNARFASGADAWAFFKETVKRTAIDAGVNSIIRLDRFDVDDGEEAPAAVMASLRKIPVVSAVASSVFRLSTNGDRYRERVVDAVFREENSVKWLRAGDLLRDWTELGQIDGDNTTADKLKVWGERYGWDKATQTEVMIKAKNGWRARLQDDPELRKAKLFDKVRRSSSPNRETIDRWLKQGQL